MHNLSALAIARHDFGETDAMLVHPFNDLSDIIDTAVANFEAWTILSSDVGGLVQSTNEQGVPQL